MRRPVFIAAAPNIQRDDFLLALRLIVNPLKWFSQKTVEEFEQNLSTYLDNSEVITFDSGRSSFYELLKALELDSGDEVILPSFSCLVIANPILWAGLKPIYVDIDPTTFNVDLEDLKRKITPKTKVILAQHTFGKPVEMEKLKSIAKDIFIVEDCAHALGGRYRGQKLATLGDATILTFGIEKVITTVRGGAVATKDKQLAKRLRKNKQSLPEFSRKRIFLCLLNIIYWHCITPIYFFGLGKFTLGNILTALAKRIGILGHVIEKQEYLTEKPSWLPAKLPGALALIGINQLRKLEQTNKHRKIITNVYLQHLSQLLPPNYLEIEKGSTNIMLRFPVLIKEDKVKKLMDVMKQHNVIIGDWYRKILYADLATLKLLGYHSGDTPNAELVAQRIINLPTGLNVTPQRAEEIAEIVKVNLV